MTNYDFVEKLKSVVNMKTLYVLGGFGLTLTASGKQRAINAQTYNKGRASMINAASNDTFAFDCVGMVKGVLWGFTGNPNLIYGGAQYKSNGVPDTNCEGMIAKCNAVHSNITSSKLVIGEFLYMTGHCGIYIGEEKVIECTPLWENKVQITNLSQRKWLKAGLLPWIDYVSKSSSDNTNVSRETFLEIKSNLDDLKKLVAGIETKVIYGSQL